MQPVLVTLNRSVTENPECSLAEKIIQTRNKKEHHHDEEQNSEEVTNQSFTVQVGVGNLLQLRKTYTVGMQKYGRRNRASYRSSTMRRAEQPSRR